MLSLTLGDSGLSLRPNRRFPLSPHRHRHLGEFSRLGRALNYLFAFSSIGISGSFVRLPTPSNVTVTGRVYHMMHDINAGQHSLRWFLYDQQERANHATGYSVPEYMLDA